MLDAEKVVPTDWILPPKATLYIATLQPAKVEFYRAGPDALINLKRGEDTLNTYQGCRVHTVTYQDLDFLDRPLCMVERERAIGDYFVLTDTHANTDPRNYRSEMRDTFVFAMTPDDFKRVTLGMMLDNCERFDASGHLRPEHGELARDVENMKRRLRLNPKEVQIFFPPPLHEWITHGYVRVSPGTH
jgi:hypothetical protein